MNKSKESEGGEGLNIVLRFKQSRFVFSLFFLFSFFFWCRITYYLRGLADRQLCSQTSLHIRVTFEPILPNRSIRRWRKLFENATDHQHFGFSKMTVTTVEISRSELSSVNCHARHGFRGGAAPDIFARDNPPI